MTAPAPARSLSTGASLEITGKDLPALEAARAFLPPGTRVNITHLGSEDLDTRVGAARAVRRLGFVPVPHISARRLRSHAELDEFLAALHAEDATEHVFVVAGDPAAPYGPYEDTLDVLRTGLLPKYGVRSVGVTGYPEGHPSVDGEVLWSALTEKAAVLAEQGLAASVITQFGFAAEPVLEWVGALRERGVLLPVRVGVPGPAGVRRLVTYAKRFGVGTSATIVRKYGFSLTHLMGTAGPDRFLRALDEGYAVGRHGEVGVHFYTFGGVGATSEWLAEFRNS